MPSATPREARLNFRLPPTHKKVIEEAAAALGQTVSDFAISTLVHTAREVVEQRDTTELSSRDRDVFLAVLDDGDRMPNKALKNAAARYKDHRGKKS